MHPPKRVKPRLGPWEGDRQTASARKCDEQAENVKTDEQAMKLFLKHVTKFIDEETQSRISAIVRQSEALITLQ